MAIVTSYILSIFYLFIGKVIILYKVKRFVLSIKNYDYYKCNFDDFVGV